MSNEKHLSTTFAGEAASQTVTSIAGSPPKTGVARQVAVGVWWIRLPVSAGPTHVNVYALQADDGLVLIDSGTNTPAAREALQRAIASLPSPIGPVRRVVLTHHHPDHAGLAGWFGDQGAEICATQGTLDSMHRLQQQDSRRTPAEIALAERAGMQGLELAAFLRRPKTRFADLVAPLSRPGTPIAQGQQLKIGPRNWTAIVGSGHAVDHLMLCSDDRLVITGDHVLPNMSTNLNVPVWDPGFDPVADWHQASLRMLAHAEAETLCLPGHNCPFTGIATRCQQMRTSHQAVISRVLEYLHRPRTAIQCMDTIYGRPLSLDVRATLLPEALGYMNHLLRCGEIQGQPRGNAILWQRQRSAETKTVRCDRQHTTSRLETSISPFGKSP